MIVVVDSFVKQCA